MASDPGTRRTAIGCGALALGGIGLVALILVDVAEPEREPSTQPSASASAESGAWPGKPAPPEASALLGGTGAGGSLGGWPVGALRLNDGRLQIVLLKPDDSGFSVFVTPKSDPGHAPEETERFKVFYGDVQQYGQPVKPEDLNKVTAIVADLLRKNEASVKADWLKK